MSLLGMVKIKPCAICATPMVIKKVKRTDSLKSYYYIYCRQCGHGLKDVFASKQAAVKSWNAAALS